MESTPSTVEELNSNVTDLTSGNRLPVYEVQEMPVERRLRAGRNLVACEGVLIEMERRKAA
jgi:hypothetical protein